MFFGNNLERRGVGVKMKREYDGLKAFKISVNNVDIIKTSGCEAMIQLKMENGVCVSPSEQQQIEYTGDQG